MIDSMRRMGSDRRGLPRGQRGISFLETLIALAILGVIAVTFLHGLTTAIEAASAADEQTTAESLAQTQMEWVKNSSYVVGATSYSPAPIPSHSDYQNYSVSIVATPLHNPDQGIQKVTVTVSHFDKEVIKLESYKRQK